jgi:hypothetical protein
MQTPRARLRSTVWCRYAIALLTALMVGAVSAENAQAQAPLKMTCNEHGANNMTLQFEREEGTGRMVEITGNNSTTLWTVLIDGQVKTPPTQTKEAPGKVLLHVGDKLTWKVTGSTHGIVFPTQQAAEAMFEFDLKMSKPLRDDTLVAGFTWGTARFSAADPLAVATVKPAAPKKAEP